jgi:dihydrofolate reductase
MREELTACDVFQELKPTCISCDLLSRIKHYLSIFVTIKQLKAGTFAVTHYPERRPIMSKLVVTMFMTLDGVIEEPQNWSFPYWNEAIGQFKNEEHLNTGAHLLGRVTYEGFAAAWPSRDGDFADRMNSLPKYVVSTTLEKAAWNNSTIIKTNVMQEIARLKQQPGQDILVAGSATLVKSLMEHDLVDEYRFLVYPLVLGGGKRLFQGDVAAKLKLAESKPFDTGVVLLLYKPERSA